MKDLLQKFENKEPEIVFNWKDPETDAEGWVVINSLRGGAAGGGTRMRKGLDMNEVLSLAKTKEQREKVHLFLEVLKDSSLTEVPDPYWGSLQDFEDVYQLIDKVCTVITKDLSSI